MADEAETQRPDFTTMQGMTWNANHALDQALDPKWGGIPPAMLKACKGVAIFSVMDYGFVFSKAAGTGVILAQDSKGNWSPPAAASVSSTGFGLVLGAAAKDMIFVIMTDDAMATIAKRKSCANKGQLNLAMGPIGRDRESFIEGDGEGFLRGDDTTYVYAFSKGFYTGADIRSVWVESQPHENHRYYGIKASNRQILFEEGLVKVPPHMDVPELYRKLDLLRDGKANVVTESERKEKDGRRIEADENGKSAKADQGESVEYKEPPKEEGRQEGKADEGGKGV